MQTKLDRLNIIIRYLKGEGIIKNQQDIVDILKSNKSSVSLALKGNEKYLTDSFLIKFNKAFNNVFNTDWLLTGLGDMRAGQEDPNLNKEIAETIQELLNKRESLGGGSVPYEFVQQLFREREKHDEIIASLQKTIEEQRKMLEQITKQLNELRKK